MVCVVVDLGSRGSGVCIHAQVAARGWFGHMMAHIAAGGDALTMEELQSVALTFRGCFGRVGSRGKSLACGTRETEGGAQGTKETCVLMARGKGVE